MNNLSERQKTILEKIIEEFVASAEPVSSQGLFQKHDFDVCPATLRIEMEKLSEQGFLEQPFVSSGRIPTDKAYRFWVDELLDEGGIVSQKRFGQSFDNGMTDSLSFFHALTKEVAELTCGLAVSYLPGKELLLKEGWGRVVKLPEFNNTERLSSFVETIEQWEQGVLSQAQLPEELEIWIGRENPFPQAQDFSRLTSQFFFDGQMQGILAIFGPKRMDYSKNIRVLQSLSKKVKNNGTRNKTKSGK